MTDLNEQLRAVGVSRDAESPSGKGVLVSFNRAPTDDELRTLHDQLRQHVSAAQAVAGSKVDLTDYSVRVVYSNNSGVPPVAAEQPAAAGNALEDTFTKEQRDELVALRLDGATWRPCARDHADAMYCAPDVHKFIEQHLRAAPQAAQGEGLYVSDLKSLAEKLHERWGECLWLDAGELVALEQAIAAHTTKERSERETRASDGWTKDAPTEQAWYWHWNGDEDCAPFPLSVMWSGTAKKCFVAINQLDPGTPHWCDEYGGYWLRIREPSIDAAMQQAASNSAEGAHGEAE